MYSIKKNIDNSIIIKKSKFITYIFRINSTFDIEKILNELKNKYSDATHICYAYIINGKEKAIDDKEPSGTAGVPILNVLKKNELNNVIAVVIRYFGGIKLGAGGLIRAYSNSIVETLKLVEKIKLIEGHLIEIEFTYDQIKQIDYILNNIKIINKDYQDNIIYQFYLTKEELNILTELKKISINVAIKEKTLIPKD